jgi:hypothetical protein
MAVRDTPPFGQTGEVGLSLLRLSAAGVRDALHAHASPVIYSVLAVRSGGAHRFASGGTGTSR